MAGLAHVEVYGVDHSPWVQAVLLGLYEKEVPHVLRTAPPPSLFLKSGILMPAASFDGGTWQLESAEILRRVGYAELSTEDSRALYRAWQGVLHRPDRATRFWGAFSKCRDLSPSRATRLRNHFLRSFATLYFFLLIRFAVWTGRQPDPDDFAEQFLPWQQRLQEADGVFFGGAAPGILDVMLFGIIQCHSSIPVPPLTALVEDPRLEPLRAWIGAMNTRFAGYPHLYSGVHFAPHAPPPIPAAPLEQAAFWLGSLCMWVAFPVTVPLIAFFVARNR